MDDIIRQAGEIALAKARYLRGIPMNKYRLPSSENWRNPEKHANFIDKKDTEFVRKRRQARAHSLREARKRGYEGAILREAAGKHSRKPPQITANTSVYLHISEDDTMAEKTKQEKALLYTLYTFSAAAMAGAASEALATALCYFIGFVGGWEVCSRALPDNPLVHAIFSVFVVGTFIIYAITMIKLAFPRPARN